MIGLLAMLVRIILLAVFTFGFVVLYEHGPAGFGQGVSQEWQALVGFVSEKTSQAPTPAPAPQS